MIYPDFCQFRIIQLKFQVCMSCGEDAAFTKRLEVNDKRIEVIGGSDKYMAVCRNCWHSNNEKGIQNTVYLLQRPRKS